MRYQYDAPRNIQELCEMAFRAVRSLEYEYTGNFDESKIALDDLQRNLEWNFGVNLEGV